MGSPDNYRRSPTPESDHKDSSPAKIPHRIFIGNLPTGSEAPSNEDVENLFDKYGRLVNVTVKPGYAFVVSYSNLPLSAIFSLFKTCLHRNLKVRMLCKML